MLGGLLMDKINFNNMFSASVYEAYIKLYEKMNELIEQSNELVIDTDKKLELMKQILAEGLEGIKPEINNQLYELINNGTIEEIINTNIFNDLNSQIKEITSHLEQIEKHMGLFFLWGRIIPWCRNLTNCATVFVKNLFSKIPF